MNINLYKNYKSLKSFSMDDLPDFIVLLGINGSGKSQLLESITKSGICKINDLPNSENIKLFTTRELIPNDDPKADWSQLKNEIVALWTSHSNFLKNKKEAMDKGTSYRNSLPLEHVELINKIAEKCIKNHDELTIEDFFYHYPIDPKLKKIGVFQHNFSQIFKRYKVKQVNNKFNKWRISEGETGINYFTDEDFLKDNGPPPWDLINEIIKTANLNYFINTPDDNVDIPYELYLTNTLNSVEIKFAELSGGEKIIMSLALSLYNSEFKNDFPDILLLDEPDAPLHPSMIKDFLNVIQKVFVEQNNVKVIITTHSPNTVALAPEESLYFINPGAKGIKKISQSNAVAKLMDGIQSIRLDLNNNRQVFVESKYDANWYNNCIKILNNHLNKEIGLYFISTGNGYSQVKEIVNKLVNEGGNNTVRGLIDWDNGNNKSNDVIFVMAEGERKEIENVILDPLIIAALLLLKQIHIYNKFPIQSLTDLRNANPEDLQRISDLIIQECITKNNNTFIIPQNNDMINCRYLGEFFIQVPKWYLECDGHKLAHGLLDIFPELQDALNHKIKDKGKALVTCSIKNIFHECERIIPMSLIDTFRKLQE